MRPINLAGIDLNLLVVLDALLEEMNVTRAGERVGLSQPAVSNTLGRLRHLLDDPLLERDGRQMRLTVRAHALKAPLRQVLEDMRQLLGHPAAFDPAVSPMCPRVFASDYTSTVLLGALRSSLHDAAPRARLDIHWSERAQVAELLRANAIDLAIGQFENMPSWVRRAPLFEDEVVIVAQQDHPVLSGELTLDRLVSYPRLGVSFHGRDMSPTERAMARAGGNGDCQIISPHAMIGPLLVCESDLIVLTSERIVRRMSRWLPLGWRPMPIDIDKVHIELLWTEHGERDPSINWFRQHLIGVAAAL